MSVSKGIVWEVVEPRVRAAGFELFDLEVPHGKSGTLRLFIVRPGTNTVLLDECATVSRSLNEVAELDDLFPGAYTLEVSSPGVNRKLSRPEHFAGAVGERIKVVTEAEGTAGRSVRGKLVKFEDNVLEVEEEGSQEIIRAPLAQVKRAQVDFQFT